MEGVCFQFLSLRHYTIHLCIRLFESTAKTTSSATKTVAASSAMLPLARISHGFKRIGAPNQRKLFCENDFLVIRGEPRCRRSVTRIIFGIEAVEGRLVVAAFDGGAITSSAGALLLGATDRTIRMVTRLASCFVDQRSQAHVGCDAGRAADIRHRARLRGPQRL